MNFTEIFEHEVVQVTVSAPTVVEPGSRVRATITLSPGKAVVLEDISWETPGVVYQDTSEVYESLPVTVEAGAEYTFDVAFYTTEGVEGFGEIEHLLHIKPESGDTVYFTVSHWISVFTTAEPSITEPLSDGYRARLINVVNARPRNGHIFLADSVSFFRDYLNLLIPESFASQLYEIFGVSPDELPVGPEQYEEFRRGTMQFYGIEELTLLAEEDCNESDDRFDATAMKEN